MFVALAALLWGAARAATPAEAAKASRADTAFQQQFGEGFFAQYWQLNPDWAIGVGYYKVAERLIVPDDRSRAQELAFVKRWQARLHAIDRQALTDAQRADWEVLDNEFEASRWELMQAREWQWNPSLYNVADPFAKLLNTPYAPLEPRLRTVLKRLQAVPAYYIAARNSIKEPTREYTQLAIEQNQGALDVFGDALRSQVDGSKLSAAERALFAQRLDAARAAINGYIAWLKELDTRLEQGNARSFRLGRELYEKRFGYQIQSGDTARALYDRAVHEKEQLHARMNVLSDQLWPKYFPNTPAPADRLEKIGRLIGKLSEQHATPQNFFAEVESLVPQLASYVTEHRLLTLDADKPLKVRLTPTYQRGVSVASADAPGPYDPAAPTYFNVLPIAELEPARAESMLREYNRWMLPILAIHEAIPGHYAQLVYANKSPSRIKTIFANGPMIEGWAVYGERMMLESGYGDDTAEMWLIYSKWNLRSVCNTILDYSVHVLNMSEEDARSLLTREAFQSDEEARGKWRRVQLSSVQLTSYFAGYAAIYDLREQLKRDYPEQFDLQRFHERFLSYGNAPVRIIKELMTK
jgi:uncharacterized protein (DUF885 family)